MITHGGAGAIAQCMRHGVVPLVVPHFFDQRFTWKILNDISN